MIEYIYWLTIHMICMVALILMLPNNFADINIIFYIGFGVNIVGILVNAGYLAWELAKIK